MGIVIHLIPFSMEILLKKIMKIQGFSLITAQKRLSKSLSYSQLFQFQKTKRLALVWCLVRCFQELWFIPLKLLFMDGRKEKLFFSILSILIES